MKNIEDMSEEELKAIEDAAILSLVNMGAAQDLAVPGYGWILRNGKPTEAGIQWYKDNEDKLEKK